ncbi:hypothetical protein ON010_g4120 [Phytophthora cinnamomi]|nr:hypothetical protein ON010_g4120 [Phytophthora cinnamomi]
MPLSREMDMPDLKRQNDRQRSSPSLVVTVVEWAGALLLVQAGERVVHVAMVALVRAHSLDHIVHGHLALGGTLGRALHKSRVLVSARQVVLVQRGLALGGCGLATLHKDGVLTATLRVIQPRQVVAARLRVVLVHRGLALGGGGLALGGGGLATLHKNGVLTAAFRVIQPRQVVAARVRVVRAMLLLESIDDVLELNLVAAAADQRHNVDRHVAAVGAVAAEQLGQVDREVIVVDAALAVEVAQVKRAAGGALALSHAHETLVGVLNALLILNGLVLVRAVIRAVVAAAGVKRVREVEVIAGRVRRTKGRFAGVGGCDSECRKNKASSELHFYLIRETKGVCCASRIGE